MRDAAIAELGTKVIREALDRVGVALAAQDDLTLLGAQAADDGGERSRARIVIGQERNVIDEQGSGGREMLEQRAGTVQTEGGADLLD